MDETNEEVGGSHRGVSKKVSRKETLRSRFISLGWRNDFLDNNLPVLTKSDLRRETEDFFIRSYASKWFANGETSIKRVLYQGGMTRQKSSTLSKTFQKLVDTCYSIEQLLDVIIDYLLGLYTPISALSANYFKSGHIVNEWFDDPMLGRIYNVSPTKTRSVNKGILYKMVRDAAVAGHTLFFHCTNWGGCQNILRQGVDYSKGRRCLDFGILPSFYLTPDLNGALEWGMKSRNYWGNEVAILIFRLDDDILNSEQAQHRVKYFEEATSEWYELTTNSRRCRSRRNALDKYDFVFGPMVANPTDVVKFDKEAVPHKTTKFQLASKTDDSDAYLQVNLIGSIWLDKQFT